MVKSADGVLRLYLIETTAAMFSAQPRAIGIAAEAVIGEGGTPGPIELILTPIQAADLLNRLEQLRDDGRLPPLPSTSSPPLPRQ